MSAIIISQTGKKDLVIIESGLVIPPVRLNPVKPLQASIS